MTKISKKSGYAALLRAAKRGLGAKTAKLIRDLTRADAEARLGDLDHPDLELVVIAPRALQWARPRK